MISVFKHHFMGVTVYSGLFRFSLKYGAIFSYGKLEIFTEQLELLLEISRNHFKKKKGSFRFFHLLAMMLRFSGREENNYASESVATHHPPFHFSVSLSLSIYISLSLYIYISLSLFISLYLSLFSFFLSHFSPPPSLSPLSVSLSHTFLLTLKANPAHAYNLYNPRLESIQTFSHQFCFIFVILSSLCVHTTILMAAK